MNRDHLDPDPPPRRGPMLVPDMTRLGAVRATADARRPPDRPLTPRQRRIKRKHLIILLARVHGLPLHVIADAFGITKPQISKICRQQGYGDL